MGFLDKLLGREKKDDMPAEPQMSGEGTQPETERIPEPPPMTSEPPSEGTGTEREDPM
jgi:hypothetical protein